MNQKLNNNNLEQCIWSQLSKTESSSFINADNPENALHKCRYKCNGYNIKCETYIIDEYNLK